MRGRSSERETEAECEGGWHGLQYIFAAAVGKHAFVAREVRIHRPGEPEVVCKGPGAAERKRREDAGVRVVGTFGFAVAYTGAGK